MKKRPVLLFSSLVFLVLCVLLLAFSFFIEPSIKISGIENGKVYAEHPDIFWEESFGKTAVTLNGKPIQSKFTVTNNGTYKLNAETALLWKKKRVSYAFTVDDQPPIKPRIKERIKPVYFQQAMFTIEREDHVAYEVTLNGEKIPMGQPIKQPGDNKLKITATKPNGLTATNEISFSIDDRTFPKENIHQFVDYYFRNDVPGILKFTGNVAIHMDGDFNDEDVKMVEQAITEMKTFFPYKMEIQESKYNPDFERLIKMVFTPTENFDIYAVDRNDVWGVEMEAISSAVYGTKESFVLIGTDKEITREYRNSVILHELLHAVGLSNHIETSQNSPLFPYANKAVTLGDKEKMYGELLYLGDLEPNIKKEEVMEQLEQRIQ